MTSTFCVLALLMEIGLHCVASESYNTIYSNIVPVGCLRMDLGKNHDNNLIDVSLTYIGKEDEQDNLTLRKTDVSDTYDVIDNYQEPTGLTVIMKDMNSFKKFTISNGEQIALVLCLTAKFELSVDEKADLKWFCDDTNFDKIYLSSC